MKIKGKKPRGVGPRPAVTKQGGGVRAKKADVDKVDKVPASDSVDISSRAQELNKVKKLLDAVPEIRGEMVVRLKTDIERGNYYIDVGKVAEKMIERALTDALSSKKRLA
jgi:flagellar biosynthesis anti-sigma factor FlgM